MKNNLTNKNIEEMETIIKNNKLDDEKAEWNDVEWGTYEQILEYLNKNNIQYEYETNHCIDNPGMDAESVIFAFIKDNKPYLFSFMEYSYQKGIDIMKNVKFTANELLDSINRELSQGDINEIYKALVAWNVGLQEIKAEDEEKLNKVIDYQFDKDYIRGFINEEILDYAIELFDDKEEI